jgi:hypothetical protein
VFLTTRGQVWKKEVYGAETGLGPAWKANKEFKERMGLLS